MHPHLRRLLQIQEPHFSQTPPGRVYPDRLIQGKPAYRKAAAVCERLRPVLVDPYYLQDSLYPGARFALTEIVRQGGVVRYYDGSGYSINPPRSSSTKPTPTATLAAEADRIPGANAQYFLAGCAGIQQILCAFRGQPMLIEAPLQLITDVGQELGNHLDPSQVNYLVLNDDDIDKIPTRFGGLPYRLDIIDIIYDTLKNYSRPKK